jgi:hypothetical protein
MVWAASEVRRPLHVGVYDPIHEIQELPASAAFVMAGLNQARSGFESREERGGAMPLIFMSKARNGSSTGQSNVNLSPLQSLNARLFIDASGKSPPRAGSPAIGVQE